MTIDLSRLDLIEGLLEPIQKLIRFVLPEFLERNLRDPEVRDTLTLAVDTALVAQYPLAAGIPVAARQTLISKQLGLVIDDVLLGADFSPEPLAN